MARQFKHPEHKQKGTNPNNRTRRKGAMIKLGSAHELNEIGESGAGSRKRMLEALTVFSQRNQAREREERRKGEEVK